MTSNTSHVKEGADVTLLKEKAKLTPPLSYLITLTRNNNSYSASLPSVITKHIYCFLVVNMDAKRLQSLWDLGFNPPLTCLGVKLRLKFPSAQHSSKNS